jgi:hypothetical protein
MSSKATGISLPTRRPISRIFSIAFGTSSSCVTVRATCCRYFTASSLMPLKVLSEAAPTKAKAAPIPIRAAPAMICRCAAVIAALSMTPKPAAICENTRVALSLARITSVMSRMPRGTAPHFFLGFGLSLSYFSWKASRTMFIPRISANGWSSSPPGHGRQLKAWHRLVMRTSSTTSSSAFFVRTMLARMRLRSFPRRTRGAD